MKPDEVRLLRACLKIQKGPAARDFRSSRGASDEHTRSGLQGASNEGWSEKTRRPEGFRAKSRLTSLLLGHRPMPGMLTRRASPSRSLPENRPLFEFSDSLLGGAGEIEGGRSNGPGLSVP